MIKQGGFISLFKLLICGGRLFYLDDCSDAIGVVFGFNFPPQMLWLGKNDYEKFLFGFAASLKHCLMDQIGLSEISL